MEKGVNLFTQTRDVVTGARARVMSLKDRQYKLGEYNDRMVLDECADTIDRLVMVTMVQEETIRQFGKLLELDDEKIEETLAISSRTFIEEPYKIVGMEQAIREKREAESKQ